MKQSTVLILAGMGVLGVGAFMYFRRGQMVPVIAGPGSGVDMLNPALLTQPGQTYPTQYGSGQVNRQDTASQPWSTAQTRAVNQQLPSSGLVDQNFIQNVAIAKGTADIVGSLTSIWDDLNLASLWDDGGDAFVEEDTFEGFSWDNYSTQWSFA